MRKTMCACTETGIMKGTAKMKKAVNFISKKVDTVKDKVEATAIACISWLISNNARKSILQWRIPGWIYG